MIILEEFIFSVIYTYFLSEISKLVHSGGKQMYYIFILRARFSMKWSKSSVTYDIFQKYKIIDYKIIGIIRL